MFGIVRVVDSRLGVDRLVLLADVGQVVVVVLVFIVEVVDDLGELRDFLAHAMLGCVREQGSGFRTQGLRLGV